MSAVHSFLEESVWDREDRRRPRIGGVSFRLQLGPIDQHFLSDFGLFYDPEDEALICSLQSAFPGISWDTFVFWKNQSQAEIMILDPMTDERVGMISVRREEFPDNPDWTNVVQIVRRN